MRDLKGDDVDHGTQTLSNVGRHDRLNVVLQMPLWILLSYVPCSELLGCHFSLFNDGLVVCLCEREHRLYMSPGI